MEDCKAVGASGFGGDIVAEFGVEGDGSGNGWVKTRKASAELVVEELA